MDDSSPKLPRPPDLPHQPPSPETAQPTSSLQRKNSSQVRPVIVLKRRANLVSDDHSRKTIETGKTIETAKSYAEMATKAIAPAEGVNITPDSARFDQAFPSLGAEVATRVVGPKGAGSINSPIPAQTREVHKEDLTQTTLDNRDKAQSLTARRNSSYAGSKEIRNQYIPKEIIRRVSFSGRDQPHFGLVQGSEKREFSSAPKPGKRASSGYYNPTRSHLEGYDTKPGEHREGNPLHSPVTRPTKFPGYRGFAPRHNSYSGRGRGKSATSPGGTPLSEISWRHEHYLDKKNATIENGGDHIGETSSLVERSLASPLGESPAGVTAGPSDITRPFFEYWTDGTSPGLGQALGEVETPTPSPKGRRASPILERCFEETEPSALSTTGRANPSPERGHQGEIQPSTLTSKLETDSVAEDHVPPFCSGPCTAGSQADDTSASKPHYTRNDVQQLGLQLSAPPPPALDTSDPAAWPCPLHRSSLLPRLSALPPITSHLRKPLSSRKELENPLPMSHQPEKKPRQRLSVNEYLGISAEHAKPQPITQLLPSIFARREGNTMLDNKAAISDMDKMADLDEGYEAIGPSKVVQYAPTVHGKASKAFAGQDKVNFGDLDSKKAAPTLGQVLSGKAAFNSPADFTGQHTSFASQSSEARLPPRSIQPPPGLPLPPGLPIPASYYQQQGIALQAGPGNISFPQPRERAGPFAQTIDNPQAEPVQYRQAYPNMGPFTVSQRSDVNESYLGLNVTDDEIKTINETFLKYAQIKKEGTPSVADPPGRRGAVSDQGGTSKGGKPANDLGNSKTTEKDNFKERFAEVFGTKGKVSIEVLQEHQKRRLVAERVRNEKLAAEEGGKAPEPVTGNTGLFPYPAHGKSDGEVTRELLSEAFKQLSSYVDDESITRDVASGEKVQPSAYQAGPWKKPPAGKTPDWISDDSTSFFDQSFGKDFTPEGKVTTDEGGPSNQPVIDAVKLKQTTSDKQSVDEVQASNTLDNVIFGPPKPPGYPNHIPREHLRPLKTFAPFENDHPKVRYGLLPANPRSVNTADKSYINYRGGAVGPVADSAPRYVYGPKGYLELAKDTPPPPPPPSDPYPFRQSKTTPSPFAALEQALGTTRFTQGVSQPSHLAAPKPPPGAKPTGGLVTDTINGPLRVNYGGRQIQLDPDGSGLSRSEILKRKVTSGSRIGINLNGPNGMEFDIDKGDFNPADHNTLGGKFKLKSQLRKEQEPLRAQLPHQSQQPQARGAHQAAPAKGTPVQGKGSDAGSRTRSVFDMPPGAPENQAPQGGPEPKKGMKGWNSGMGGR